MSLILRCCALMLLLFFIGLGGCTYSLGGRDFADPAWAASKGRAGKVLLLVSGSPEDEMAPDHMEEVTSIASAALSRLPETTVLMPAATASTAPATAPARWAASMSDAQAIEAAKARGADSVCLLTIGYYSGVFGIGLMPLPGWYGATHILYTVRIIDVRSGSLLAHATSYYSTGGDYQIRTRDDMKRDLAFVLARDLATCPESKP